MDLLWGEQIIVSLKHYGHIRCQRRSQNGPSTISHSALYLYALSPNLAPSLLTFHTACTESKYAIQWTTSYQQDIHYLLPRLTRLASRSRNHGCVSALRHMSSVNIGLRYSPGCRVVCSKSICKERAWLFACTLPAKRMLGLT